MNAFKLALMKRPFDNKKNEKKIIVFLILYDFFIIGMNMSPKDKISAISITTKRSVFCC